MLYGRLLPSLWVLISIREVEKTSDLHILHQKDYLAGTVSMVLKIDICLLGSGGQVLAEILNHQQKL